MMLSILFGLSYATEICSDGWISNSSGSGTCSHHGGIARYPSTYVPSVSLYHPMPPSIPKIPLDSIGFGSVSQFASAYQGCEKNLNNNVLFACKTDSMFGTEYYLGAGGIYYGFVIICSNYYDCKGFFDSVGAAHSGFAFDGESHSHTRSSADGRYHIDYRYDRDEQLGSFAFFDSYYLPIPKIMLTRNCNVRKAPDTNSEILFVANAGERLSVNINDFYAELQAADWIPPAVTSDGWVVVHRSETIGFISPLCYQ